MERKEESLEVSRKKSELIPSNQEKMLFWKTRIVNLSNILVDHINRFGFCVIDHFLGAILCSHVLREVNSRNTTTESPGIKRLLMIMDCLMKQSSRLGLDIPGFGGSRRHVRINDTSPEDGSEMEVCDPNTALTATLFLSQDDQGGIQLHPLLKENTMATIPPAMDRVVFFPTQKVTCTTLTSKTPGLSMTVSYLGKEPGT
eukprot:GFUD01034568.1.p1 GENE.GFUD01034568.1~~GFUD01034568.1.p1  ORF type:complete len:201 (+),score=35.97 GFUD01034568.1:194-796(+)